MFTDERDPGLLRERALDRLDSLVDKIQPRDVQVTWRTNVDPTAKTTIADTLPSIDQFELAVNPRTDIDDVVVEIFASTEKSGSAVNGWMIELANEFNLKNVTISGGKTAKIQIRQIPSGTGYQFLAADEAMPGAFSPSNHLWISMAQAQGVAMTPIRERLVDNVAGLVMKDQVAAELRSSYGDLEIRNIVDAVVQGTITMGYTIGYEADIDELNRLSSLVEAASLSADQDDISYRIGMLLNAEM